MIKRYLKLLLLAVPLLLLVGCASHYSRPTSHRTNTAASGTVFKSNVAASYYHDKFNGRKTASGAIFSNQQLTSAHPSLPFGTQLKVTNRANGKSVIVTVTDRGPFVKGRELDLTKRAFMEITDNKNKGVLQVDVVLLSKK